MHKALTRSALLALACAFALAAFAEPPREINVPAGDLLPALESFSRQADVELVFQPEQLKGLRTKGVNGVFSFQEAVKKLLEGTQLELRTDTTTGAMMIGTAAAATKGAGVTRRTTGAGSLRLAQMNELSPEAGTGATDATAPASTLEEIVVTGTHIGGVKPVGSALKVYTREDLEQSGAATVDQFARQMPENFSNIDRVANASSNTIYSRFNAMSGNNLYGGAAFNLRGTGATSTLTLLNGHRLAPSSFDGSMVDISQIPLSAIERIEVMTDGASAIYGADAIAGVVNLITRNDFDGAETALRYGGATGGGNEEFTGSQLLGNAWSSGNAFLNYEYDRQAGLYAADRKYLPDQGGPRLLLPGGHRNSVFLAGNQDLRPTTRISGDAMYSDHRYFDRQFTDSSILTSSTRAAGVAKQSGVNLVLEQALAGSWHAKVSGSHSKVQQMDDRTIEQVFASIPQEIISHARSDSSLSSADVLTTGSLAPLPAGSLKVALGASLRTERFSYITGSTGSFGEALSVLPKLQRHVRSLYGEVLVPVVAEANARPGLRRLELSFAARNDHYPAFGSSTNPKVGLLWEPAEGVSIRSTYGTSFRAPLLSQLGEPTILSALPITDTSSPTGSTNAVILQLGNAGLRAEESKSLTAGIDFQPTKLPGLSLSATYFRISYTNRISTPPSSSGGFLDLGDPALAPFLERNPPLSEIQAFFDDPDFTDFTGLGPAGVEAIFDFRYNNIAASRESGVDLNVDYRLATAYGDWNAYVDVNRFLVNDFQSVFVAPFFSILDNFGQPVKWKGRGGVGWTRRGFYALLSVNYLSGYENTLFTPSQPIDSWLTGDAFLSYKTPEDAGAYFMRNLTFSLSVSNIANERPPVAQIPVAGLLPGQNPLNYDPTNGSPVGRMVSLQMIKRW